MTKNEFMQLIIDNITASGALPFSIPTAELERIITVELKSIAREYREATETAIYVINKQYFCTQEFKNNRTIIMPDCVIGLQKLQEINGGQKMFGIQDPDMKFDRIMAADMYLTPFSTDQIMYRTLQWNFWDLSRSFLLTDIQHDFNMNTKKLIITGRDPRNSLFALTTNVITEDKLYEDPIVIRWITAKAKISLSKILGLFDYTLLGNVKINFDRYATEGKEEFAEVMQEIRSQDTADWFLMCN